MTSLFLLFRVSSEVVRPITKLAAPETARYWIHPRNPIVFFLIYKAKAGGMQFLRPFAAL